MNLDGYVPYYNNPYFTIIEIGKSDWCHRLMINKNSLHLKDWYCAKYQEKIGSGMDGTEKVIKYCQYVNYGNCWVEKNRKDAKEKADKEKADKLIIEKEKTAAEERALLLKFITEYTSTIEHNPNDAKTYFLRGGVYVQLQDFDHAIYDFTKAIELNPNDAEAYMLRGQLYYEREDDKAIADLNEAIRLNPNYKNAYMFRAAIYEIKEKYKKSILDYKEALRIAPNDSTIKTLLKNATELKKEKIKPRIRVISIIAVTIIITIIGLILGFKLSRIVEEDWGFLWVGLIIIGAIVGGVVGDDIFLAEKYGVFVKEFPVFLRIILGGGAGFGISLLIAMGGIVCTITCAIIIGIFGCLGAILIINKILE